jgi:23S rRNA-/tRNA-specific pseudouridylate synthase
MEFPSDGATEPEVVYEDEWLVAVRKPARMHSAPGLGGGDLCAWVFERYPEAGELGPEAGGLAARRGAGRRGEGGLLHRLDYETSGIVLFARKAASFASLLDQQARGGFYKEYLALCAPSRDALPRGSVPARGLPGGVDPARWTEARDALDAGALSALLRGALSRGRDGSCGIGCAFRPYGPRGARVACLEPGEGAGDAYRSDILDSSGNLELRLGIARGFRHQIRAQLAWIGLPILGDPYYGGADDERLRLYAVRLSFAHPESGRALSLAAEP